MVQILLISGIVILVCVFLNRFSEKIGISMLLAFILLGMLFGTDGIFQIDFNQYGAAQQICSTALILIMFYGGFGTNWYEAKSVALQSALLSTVGVVLTSLFVGVFCWKFLDFGFLESLLLGAVISSTDAAAVFSILRSKKMGLKYKTASMLELESGSNDPCAYMLTLILLSVIGGKSGGETVVFMVLAQFVFGTAVGFFVAFLAVWVLKRFHFATDGFDAAFVIGVALLSYALSALIGGNGYLSAYICGIVLGNSKFQGRKNLVPFFDGVTGLMQMLIFFLLGLLATPSQMPGIFIPALAITLFLTLIARPAAVFCTLLPFGCKKGQMLLVSFAGLRGAASIVFAIMVVVDEAAISQDLFHIVFCIVLLSIAFQGSFLPWAAKVFHMVDSDENIMKTFSDYSEEVDLQFIRFHISAGHPWEKQAIGQVILPPDSLVALIIRQGQRIIPDGETVLCQGDQVVISAHGFVDDTSIGLKEQTIGRGSVWIGKTISDFSPDPGELVILILREGSTVVPKGDTLLLEKDVLVILSSLPE